MDSTHAKYPVSYDEFPEVVENPREANHKILLFDPVYKEAVPGTPATAAVPSEDERNAEGSQLRTICGFAPRKFWVILILVATAVAAAVGGGVGGGIAASRSQHNESSAESSSGITSTLTDQPSSSTPTSSLRPEPTFLNNQTQDFAFQPFERRDYKGQVTGPIKIQGPFDLNFNSSSYVWQPNGTHCCVTMCRQSKWVGWWCTARFQPNASASFDNGDIGCTGQETEETSKAICTS
ncbi:hypothetical protein HD806DRAFT_540083 [Xylariaceae sp. AK1471]|nr:hypothetical protein HD806DRAFT_540083 [Xylariaceae sp. AK1471]